LQIDREDDIVAACPGVRRRRVFVPDAQRPKLTRGADPWKSYPRITDLIIFVLAI
jgi:hypothetical protein